MNSFLCNVAQNYFDYLEKFDKGYESIKIKFITQNIFGIAIHLAYKLKSTENLALRTKLGDFVLDEKGEISISSYDENTKTIYLNVDSKLKDKIFKIKDSIELVADLKFLVKNVYDFFSQNHPLFLPQNKPELNPDIDNLKSLKIPPNKEQLEALKGIFNTPFCYIWGVAGSGKTKVVLLHALAFYLKAGLKVAILAPTNNALEQCLSTLITNLNQIGYSTDTILRLGTPSQSFAENFPKNCDSVLKENPQDYKEKIQKVQIMAMTLDTFLRRSDVQSIDFSHYFVDEAAFAPLIKILPLCAFSAPLTLLGDHKQLQPICVLEQNHAKMQEWNLSKFWQYSALFVESFLNLKENFESFLSTKSEIPPTISNQSSLNQTYRYGDNVAKLLDFYIYKNNLKGLQSTTEIYHINTQQDKIKLDKANLQEALMCRSLAEDFIINGVEFAILTPFVNQRKLILEKAPALALRECVFTIHAAQGQEFDFILFSPVELHYYLSDSNNKNALFALNVAISRAKKGIILISHLPYWLQQKGQFLCDLARISKPFSLANITK